MPLYLPKPVCIWKAYKPLASLSSQTQGAVGAVADAGTYEVFADDPALVSSVGLRVDNERNRLLVAVADSGYNLQRTTAAMKAAAASLVA